MAQPGYVAGAVSFGLAADRPYGGTPGQLFFATDTKTIYAWYPSATSWTSLGTWT
jgi:hypothetical protein